MCARTWRLHALTAALVLAAHLIKGSENSKNVINVVHKTKAETGLRILSSGQSLMQGVSYETQTQVVLPEKRRRSNSSSSSSSSTSSSSSSSMSTSSSTPRLFIEVLSCGEAGAGRARRYVGLYTGPYFDPAAPNNITAQLGTHAYLPCKVRQLSNKSVSWIRRRDAHILTVDRFTFIADERFQAFLVEATDTWTLQVKYVQARDAGVYECQVGTEPKMSHFVQLNVVVPKIEIAGEAEVFVRAGSTVRVTCVITQALEEPAYIFWYHNGARVLDYDRSARDIRMERRAPDTTVGDLVMYNTRREDSGNYSCAPSNLDSASVVLHVLSGEQPAAMQHGNAAAPRAPTVVALGAALVAAAPRALLRLLALMALALLFLLQCHDEEDERR